MPKPLIGTQRCELGARLPGVDKCLPGVSFQLFIIQSKCFQALSYLAISSLYLHFLSPISSCNMKLGRSRSERGDGAVVPWSLGRDFLALS